jgi:GNAT superfamily N-acetyltransferase
MIKYEVASFKKNLDSLKDLFKICYEEIENDSELLPFNPDYEAYATLEDVGLLYTILVKEEDKIIGYYISVVTASLHSKEALYAHNDSLYILKKYRKGGVAYNLFKYAERCFEDLGVKAYSLHTKTKQPFDTLCERLGMTCIERHYIKYLGE